MDFNFHPPSLRSQSVDFNVYSGEDDSSFQCTPPNAYISSQALRVGLFGRTEMHSLPLPFPNHKEIEREIMKERIREEILADEMAERRMLEDEVRREIEMERAMKLRILQMERTRLALLAGTSDTVNHRCNQMSQSFFPSRSQARSGASRYVGSDAAEFTFRERSPSHLRQKIPMEVEESFLHHDSEKFSPSEQNTTLNVKLSGTKRKKTLGESQLPEKQWGCALCEVRTTCENGLKAHLEGKKHKAKEAKNNSRKEPLLTSEKTTSGSKNKQPPVKSESALQTKGTSASGSKNKQPPVKSESAPQTKGTSASGPKNKQNGKRFWCSVCKVKCNSENMLEFHRAGKKHKIFSELKENGSFTIKNPADTGAPVVKEAAKAGAEEVTEGEPCAGVLPGNEDLPGDGVLPGDGN